MKGFVLAAIAAAIAFAQPVSAQDQKFITIGTASVTGVYYPAGGAICRFVNEKIEEHGLRCSVQSTGGSVYNLNTIRAGDMTLGITQSGTLYKAYKGLERWEGDAFEDVRALFALHSEAFTLVARADSGIEEFSDIAGHRVQVGVPGSGTLEATKLVMDAFDIQMSDLALAAKLKPAEQSRALCDNQIDAFIYVVGHPAATIQEATTVCDSNLIDVWGNPVKKLIEKHSYYGPASIPGGMYRGNSKKTKTFGVRAVVVSSADVPADKVYQVVKAVFENLEKFKSLHPAFQSLTKQQMIKAGIAVPLHEGAKRYYKEAGLM